MPPVPAGQQARRLLVMVPWLIGNSPVVKSGNSV
jgi:hypothetical protein